MLAQNLLLTWCIRNMDIVAFLSWLDSSAYSWVHECVLMIFPAYFEERSACCRRYFERSHPIRFRFWVQEERFVCANSVPVEVYFVLFLELHMDGGRTPGTLLKYCPHRPPEPAQETLTGHGASAGQSQKAPSKVEHINLQRTSSMALIYNTRILIMVTHGYPW